MESRQDLYECGLARAVLAEQAMHFTALNGQADPIQRADAAEIFRQI